MLKESTSCDKYNKFRYKMSMFCEGRKHFSIGRWNARLDLCITPMATVKD